MSVISTGSCSSARATRTPPNPPPMITTRWGCGGPAAPAPPPSVNAAAPLVAWRDVLPAVGTEVGAGARIVGAEARILGQLGGRDAVALAEARRRAVGLELGRERVALGAAVALAVSGVLDQLALGLLEALGLAAPGLVDRLHRRVLGLRRHHAADPRRLGGGSRLLLGHEGVAGRLRGASRKSRVDPLGALDVRFRRPGRRHRR